MNLDELEAAAKADARFIEHTGERTVSYLWIERALALIARVRELEAELLAERQTRERDEARTRLLTAAGDDLCRLSQEEIKAYTSGEVPIPPKDEFLPSCEKFWEQTAARAGVNHNCLTLAQLVAECEQLRQRAEQAEQRLAALEAEIEAGETTKDSRGRRIGP